LTGLNLCNYLDRYILPAVLGPIEKDLGLNDSEFGTVAAIFMAGYFLTAPVFGYLGDHLPRRWLIALGVAVWCAGTMLSGTAHGLGALVCFRILVGIGEASYGTLGPAWIADLYAPAKRNNALSFFYIATPVGSALGYILGGALASAYGWRTAFLVAGLPGLILGGLLLLLREPARGESDGGARCPRLRPASAKATAGKQGYGGQANALFHPTLRSIAVPLKLSRQRQKLSLGRGGKAAFRLWRRRRLALQQVQIDRPGNALIAVRDGRQALQPALLVLGVASHALKRGK
jgi:MFS family permease